MQVKEIGWQLWKLYENGFLEGKSWQSLSFARYFDCQKVHFKASTFPTWLERGKANLHCGFESLNFGWKIRQNSIKIARKLCEAQKSVWKHFRN